MNWKKLNLKNLFIAFLIAGSSMTMAQEASFSDVKNLFKADFGSIIDGNEVKGYYVFYKQAKADRKNRVYALRILDANLNEVAKKIFVDSKNLYMMEATYNGKGLAFKFYNSKEKTVQYRFLDRKAKLLDDVKRDAGKYEVTMYGTQIQNEAKSLNFHSINGKGWVDYYLVKGKKLGFSVQMYNNKGEEEWTYESDANAKYRMGATHLASGKNTLLSMVAVNKSAMSKDVTYQVLGLDIGTGDELFMEPLESSKYTLQVMNTFFDNKTGTFKLMGQYYLKSDKSMKSASKGLFFVDMDEDGEVGEFSYISWSKDASKFLSVDHRGSFKDGGYLYFHNILRTSNGKIFAIGEQYQKSVSALGVASTVLAASGGGSSNTSTMKMVIRDIMVFELNENLELEDIKVYEKNKSDVLLPSGYGMVSQHLLAQVLKQYGYFDYNFTQTDKESNNFSVNYVTLEKQPKKLFKKVVYGFINYNVESDDFALEIIDAETEASLMWVSPAKPGYMLVNEYDAKKDRLSMRLEKLNFE